MDRHALQLAVCVATIAFAVAFAWPMITGHSTFWYYPLAHRWAFEPRPHGLAMDFYGRCGVATGAAVIAASIAYPLGRWRRPSDRLLGLFTAWALTVTLLVMANYAWTLHFRHPMPEPLPADYQPR